MTRGCELITSVAKLRPTSEKQTCETFLLALSIIVAFVFFRCVRSEQEQVPTIVTMGNESMIMNESMTMNAT